MDRARGFWRGNWWVLLFSTCATSLYCHSISIKKKSLCNLAIEVEKKEKELLLAEEAKEELKEKIASQNDPAWVELVLMRDLGVVPEGWLKVHFKK